MAKEIKPSDEKKNDEKGTRSAKTLTGTAIALDRELSAVLENYKKADG